MGEYEHVLGWFPLERITNYQWLITWYCLDILKGSLAGFSPLLHRHLLLADRIEQVCAKMKMIIEANSYQGLLCSIIHKQFCNICQFYFTLWNFRCCDHVSCRWFWFHASPIDKFPIATAHYLSIETSGKYSAHTMLMLQMCPIQGGDFIRGLYCYGPYSYST